MNKLTTATVAALLETILDGVVKVKKMDGPLTPLAKARLKAARKLLKQFKKGSP